MTQNRRYAVTGGIGSGKSFVCALLRERGYAVFSCDEISRELWKEPAYLDGIAERFPKCVREGSIDRKALSALVFSDGGALARLNAYAHPRILERLFLLMKDTPVSFAEVPLLYETGLEGRFDGTIAVVRDREARKKAVAMRDGLSEEEIERRMNAQCGPKIYAERGAWILENNGSAEDLEQNLNALLAKIGL